MIIHKLSGTVNALLLESTAMDAIVLIVTITLKMSLRGMQLLNVFYDVNQMLSGERSPIAHM